MKSPPLPLQTLIGRYDADVFEPEGGQARVRLEVRDDESWDAVLEHGSAYLKPARGSADATLTADERTWDAIAGDIRGGFDAYRSGRLSVRHNLHVGVGFLAATSALKGPARLRFRDVRTRRGRLSTLEAGSGPPLVAIHGLGATKGSFLPTVIGLAGASPRDRARPAGVRRLRQADRRRVRRPVLRPRRRSRCSTRWTSSTRT